MAQEVLAELTAHDLRPVFLQPAEAAGVKGLDAVEHLVLIQQGAGGRCQRVVVAPLRFQLHHQRQAALLKQRQHLLQQGDPLLRSLQTVAFQLLRRKILHLHLRSGGAQETCVVDDGQTPVLHQMHVQLAAEAPTNGLLKGQKRVLRRQILSVVAPMGIAVLPQQLPEGMSPTAHRQQGEYLRQNQQNDYN